MTDTGREKPRILSASRRTDIPGWYTPWFLDRIQKGRFNIKNPYTRKVRTVPVSPDKIHSIVLWSKNYAPFLDLKADQTLTNLGYKLYFNFTINSTAPVLEPFIPCLESRLEQLALLADRYDPRQIAWRFDPVCFFKDRRGNIHNNLEDFPAIARFAAKLKIPKCVTSFYDPYKKVENRIRYSRDSDTADIQFMDPDLETKITVIQRMAAVLEPLNIGLFLCCEPDLFQAAEKKGVCGIKENACIDGPLLKEIHGGELDLGRDYGQRYKKGCRCRRSIDVGSYEDHPCYHNCLFCYANTGRDMAIKQSKVQ